MDRTTQSNYSGGMHPSRPSPLSYSFQQEELSYPEEKYAANEKQMKNRSCLPGYPNQRSSTSNVTNISRRAQQVLSASTVRSNHHDVVDTLRTDEIFMMDHLAINPPSTSMPNPTNMNVPDDNRDLYRNYRDQNHSTSHLRSSSSSSLRGTSQNRRSRQASSSISRSATAALATPRSSSSSTSRGRSSSTYHHQNHHPNARQQYSTSTASTGSRYNYPNAATSTATSASPSKRSSSRISFSSQQSVTTTAPSIHDVDDNGTVSTRRSETSASHRHDHNHKHSSPIGDTHTATMGKAIPNGKKLSSNQSADSATTKSSSGTNAMGNTKAMTQRRNTQSSAMLTEPRLASEMSSTINPSQVTLDVDTMKTHVQETRRVIDGKYGFLLHLF